MPNEQENPKYNISLLGTADSSTSPLCGTTVSLGKEREQQLMRSQVNHPESANIVQYSALHGLLIC